MILTRQLTIFMFWAAAMAQAHAQAPKAHSATGHTRAFREKLAPMLGALYDERLNRLLP